MAISLAQDDEDDVVSAINTTPLVDVMLVLLIIFLITIPVVTHTVAVDLPHETNQPRLTKPENINLAITRDGHTYWNETLISNTEDLVARLKQISTHTPQPEIQIRGDSHTAYYHVGKVVVACQRAGIVKIGFITEPPARG